MFYICLYSFMFILFFISGSISIYNVGLGLIKPPN